MYELTVAAEFEAAHLIPGYPGKCRRLHGHNWKVEIGVSGKKLNELGMLIDFRDLKSEVAKIIERLDHTYLNENEYFPNLAPTAENLAKFIYDELAKGDLAMENVKLDFVEVWESPKSAVKYFPDKV